MAGSKLSFVYLSQEDLLRTGCFDIKMAMEAAEKAMLAYRKKDVIFPDKIVQIFNQETQERINCLPATLVSEKICGVKWVSVFPQNPVRFGLQNLSAVIILSEYRAGLSCRGDGRDVVLEYARRSNGSGRRQIPGQGRFQNHRLHWFR